MNDLEGRLRRLAAQLPQEQPEPREVVILGPLGPDDPIPEGAIIYTIRHPWEVRL
jgi:hypothetical protein